MHEEGYFGLCDGGGVGGSGGVGESDGTGVFRSPLLACGGGGIFGSGFGCWKVTSLSWVGA